MKTVFNIILLAQIILVLLPELSLSQNKAYHIGPRDILILSIYAGGEKQQEVYPVVSGQGVINVPFIGSVKAEGLTIDQLERLITEFLTGDYFVNPEVNIRIEEYHSIRYYIAGTVRNPGLYEMTSEASFIELIAKAGGVLPERGNVAYILHRSAEQITEGEEIESLFSQRTPVKIDLKELLDKGNMRHNMMLQSGDGIYIPPAKKRGLAELKISVMGEVKKPGFYDYRPGLTALDACIMAGGFDEFSAPNRTKVIRQENGEQVLIRINLDNVKKGKLSDVKLKPGDRVHIPESWL